MTSSRDHGPLRKLFDDVYFVTGVMRMASPPVSMSRNMTVVRHDGELTIINSMRLSDEGLKELDALGKVTRVLCIAGFHGSDDKFYKERYGAEVLAMKGHRYVKGFDVTKPNAPSYFEADGYLTAESELPFAGRVFAFETSSVPEGIIRLDREGGILVTGDSMQNMGAPDSYFSFVAKVTMRVMGFFKPHNLGPGWLKYTKPESKDVRRVLDLEFEHVLPAHGAEVIGGAEGKYGPAFDRLR